ncbi:hypothetical protein KI387_033945 [Taxus chinensis]|uniref:Fungal lipase-type domain-containing protein n=1 Tax=Taxus chinensis TaxID=29808 RepID=A0AA38BZK8_TAXCH|nr:hypothetical protein KI387_033945 [Taxus chinensis]
MCSKRDVFMVSGPRHLTNIDWGDPNHRRCIAASLVQGVYVQERIRQESRNEVDIQVEMWWRFFSFTLLHPLHDNVDGSIFGAVYKWSNKSARPPGAPKIVVAFRGTVTKADSLRRDLQLNFNILTNQLHTTCRFDTAFDALNTNVHKHGYENVWIAGHSLGAALAMLASRKMAEEQGHFLQAHLFNPPFVSAPVERLRNEKVKLGLHIGLSLIAAGLSMLVHDDRARIESHKGFSVLRSWVPFLYVNPQDDLCSGYVGYFSHQKVMNQIGAGSISCLAAQHSVGDIVLSAFGKESKAGHLIPCARLTVNLSPAPDFRRAHGIHQWWADDLKIQCTEYTLPPLQALV